MRMRAACALIALVSGFSGCGAGDALERAGVTVRPAADWRPIATSTWPVPGVPLAAWSGPDGASLVVYKTLPDPDGRAEGLAVAIVNRLDNLPGVKVVSRGTEEIDGLPAAHVECNATGTGDAFAPTGRGEPIVNNGKTLRPTRRVVVGVLRGADTLFLLWHAPSLPPMRWRRACARRLPP